MSTPETTQPGQPASPFGPLEALLLVAAIYLASNFVPPIVLELFAPLNMDYYRTLYNGNEAGDRAVIGEILALFTCIGAAAGIALALWALAWRSGGAFWEPLALRPIEGRALAVWTLRLFGLSFVGLLLVSLASQALGLPEPTNPMLDAPFSLALLVAVVIAAPVFEEILIRGILLPALVNSEAGLWGGLILSSLLFAILHDYNIAGQLYIFALGMLFGLARMRSGSLSLPIALHAGYNAVILLLPWL